MGEENRFGEFISKLRKERQISLEQLSDGICALSMISRFEHGEREPDKLLQNRILTRLGAVPENYENFLYYKDYCRWEKRQGIVHHILEENMEMAKSLLEGYAAEYDMTYALERQFYLAMLVQIKRYEGGSRKELAELFEEALSLTVPEVEERGLQNRILSLEELNLLLEYMFCRDKELPVGFYETLLEYIQNMECTTLALAKIFPKVVYYFYLSWKDNKEQDETTPERLLELCDKAIELLRDANRMFYLWELFCMREQLAVYLPDAIRTEENFLQRAEQCTKWKETLEEIYRDYNVSIAMYEFCYLYVESENYCIGDVIRIRRKMLGLSQEKLSEGICDSRTVSRLERHISKPQKEIVQLLFDRLNLSTELCRTELVTDSQEAIEKYGELKICIDNYEYDKAEKIIEELYNILPMDKSFNNQLLLRNSILNKMKAGYIKKEESVKKFKQALEFTVPYQAIVTSVEKYLTNEEISGLVNITLGIDWSYNEMKECIDVLESICNGPRYLCNYVRVYEFIMSAVSSHLGNHGEFNRSNEIKRKIIRLSVQNRRICAIHLALYGLVWNEGEKIKLGMVFQNKMNVEKELGKCIQISSLCKDTYREMVYCDKLSILKNPPV